MGWQDYRSQHEPILYGWKKGDRQFYGDRKQTTIWDYRRDAQQTYVHPTQKPTEIMMRGIKNSSQEGGRVLDPFLGSGTTLIAAEKTGRICYGMEIEPKYCDVIIKRYADYVGVDEASIRKTREKANG
jgi:site-specific DNA-methyltransferase (adenine-specific)